MKVNRKYPASLLAVSAFLAAPAAQALEIQAGDWKFSFNGNVNVHYINTQCDDTAEVVAGGLACNVGVDNDAEDGVSSVSNGLLPAAFVFGASTTQKGYDLSANLGLYPGVSTNDGGSPNLQQGADGPGTNTGLGTTGLDVRQVFLTFGNKDIGTFTFGRNFGLFGFDAIINDMTIPGVGVAGGAAGAGPANTTLGSIGLGYIYTDTLSQMNYTTPDFGGLKLTFGIFDPIEPIGATAAGADASPGFHGKAAFTVGGLYLSASFLFQENNTSDSTIDPPGPTGAPPDTDFDTEAFDVGGKFTAGPFEVLAWYYDGKGIGTTALLLLPADATGDERDSDGFLAQATFKAGDTKFGVNYGESNLDLADGDGPSSASTLVEKNSKYTVGAYHSLTPNLTLLAEFSDVEAEAHNGNKNDSSNFNVGAFLSF
ncbi:MAG: porin [Panacagrimonas sp.]